MLLFHEEASYFTKHEVKWVQIFETYSVNENENAALRWYHSSVFCRAHMCRLQKI